MVERPLRLAALSVLGGPNHGRRHDLEEVVSEVLVGSDPDCHLHVDVAGISPIHARLWTDLNGAIAHDTRAPIGLYVNTTRVETEAPVGDGDMLWLGPPQEPGSVCIQCHFEPWVEVLPEAAVDMAGPQTPAADGEPPAILAEEGQTGPGIGEEGAPSDLVVGESPPEAVAPESVEPQLFESEPASSQSSDSVPIAFEAALAEDEPPVFDVIEPSEGPSAQPSALPPAAAPPPATAPPAARAPAEPPPAAAPPAAAAPAEPPAAEEDDDPFFVGETKGDDAPPSTPPSEPPPPAAAAPAAASDDWFFSEAPAPAAPTALVDPSPPAAVPEPEDFFIADAAVVEAPPELSEAPGVGAPAVSLLPEPPTPPRAVSAPESPPSPPVAPTAPPEAPPAAPDLSDRAHARAPRPPRQPADSSPTESASPGALPSVAPGGPERAGGAPPTTSTPRRPPSSARPTGAAPRRAAAAGRRPVRRPRSGTPPWLRSVGLGIVALVVVGAGAFGVLQWLGRKMELVEVAPSRVRVGQRATLVGSGFSDDPAGNTVVFGDHRAKVLQASATRLEVEVPEAVAEAGAERRVPVVVKRGSRETPPLEVSVFQGPRLHGLSPDVAMPGEEVLLAGAGWGLGASVRFGEVPATLVETSATEIRAIVPPLAAAEGTAAPVVVTVGGIESNPAPFFVGRLPLVTGVEPKAASPGDIVSVSGRGFQRDLPSNDVRIGGRPAAVVSAFSDALRVVVPRVTAAGDAALELRVPGSTEVGRAAVQIGPIADSLGFAFVTEPFPGTPPRPHAVLTTGLGPAFVLASSGGRSAAERALEAQQRLNAAAAVLGASAGLVPEARDLETRPVIGLPGRPDVLLEVTPEDAAAYAEDWTGLRGRGGAVTPARLARWWEAMARDLTLVLVRGERPRFAASLAPEGRVLQEVYDAAQSTGRPGVPRDLVAGMRASVRDALRVAALRVPPSVTAAVPPPPGAVAAAPTPQSVAPLRLEGTWSGSEEESGERRYLTVRFRRGSGSVAYEGGITFTLPFLAFDQPRRDQVHFTVEFRGGLRHYVGRWDGEALRGEIARDEAGKNVVGHFELRPR